MTVVIETEHLSKTYPGSDVPAVDDVSFRVAEGEVIGLLGPNGAGKTSLIKLICGVTTASSGSLRVFGADPVTDPVTAKSALGVMHQSAPFDLMLNVVDNLKIGARFADRRWREVKDWVAELLDLFELTPAVRKPAFQLSGGQRQRLQLVRALITLPKVLVLDEPTTGLDVSGRRQVWETVAKLRAEYAVSVLWTSHYIEEIERNCERILLLHKGRLLRDADPAAIAAEFGSSGVRAELTDPAHAASLLAWATERGLNGEADELGVEITGKDARERMPELVRFAHDEHIELAGVSVFAASLEDAFVALTVKESR
ncbi:ABC transporter ATP-binding protein [Phytomonospora endophytica]|uniref:ABC-type multidrug transport system ATPase subunit n=1 Tax=Phytomonospora endophytica TaxID=714109 RepID=A0A841FZL8_9ACTN|nr:ABC transporter ATP-binding protein [Phytomonospora endophytica]MBB6037889.1 ABC-type multidrug transport system ATPase subunit [Phytomonospora endophytica]GIG68789.1 ABC transporter ATP-binding protein [Phytomonospora endophytica]